MIRVRMKENCENKSEERAEKRKKKVITLPKEINENIVDVY